MSLRSDSATVAALLVFLLGLGHLVIDIRAMDISGAPRLLAFALVVGAFLAWSFGTRRYEQWDFSAPRNPVVFSFAAYAALTASSALFAVNPAAGASDITATSLSLVVLCLVGVLFRTRPDLWPLVLKIFAATGFLFAAIAWTETFAKWGWGMHPRAEMELVRGTMYNGNLHASFLALLLPFAACGVLVLRGAWRYLSIASVLALGVIVSLMQTRSVYVGLSAAFALGVILLCFHWRAWGFRRSGRVVLFAVVTLAVAALVALVLLVPDNPVSARIRSLAVLDFNSTAARRLVVWLATWQMALDHLLTGVGAGNFGVQMHRYFDTSDPAVATWNSNWNHPHNDFLCALAEKGLPGLVCLLAVFLFAAANLLRALGRATAPDKAMLSLCALVGLVAYAFVAFFDFPLARPGHQVVLAFYLGASIALAPPAIRAPASVPSRSLGLPRLLVVCGVIVCLLAAAQAFLAVRQEWFVKLARESIDARDWEGAVRHARQARFALNQLDPFGVPVVFHEALGHLMSGRETEATECFVLAASQSPYRDYLQQNVAALYSAQGRDDLAVVPLQGIAARRKQDPLAVFYLAQTCLRSGNYAEALNILSRLPPGFEPDRVRALREEAERMSAAHPAQQIPDANDG